MSEANAISPATVQARLRALDAFLQGMEDGSFRAPPGPEGDTVESDEEFTQRISGLCKEKFKALGVRIRHLHDSQGRLGGTMAMMDVGDGSFAIGASFVNHEWYRQVQRAANALRSLGVEVKAHTLPFGPTRAEGRERALESLIELGVVVRPGEIDFNALKPVVTGDKPRRNRKGEARVLRQAKAILAAFKRLEKADVSSDDGLQITA